MIDIFVNGAPVGAKLVIPANNSDTRTLVIVHKQGASASGKVVSLETSAPLYINSLNATFDPTGKCQFVVGPSFGARGSVTLTISPGHGKRTLELVFD